MNNGFERSHARLSHPRLNIHNAFLRHVPLIRPTILHVQAAFRETSTRGLHARETSHAGPDNLACPADANGETCPGVHNNVDRLTDRWTSLAIRARCVAVWLLEYEILRLESHQSAS